MALPSSGTISISQIRTELSTSNGSLRYLSSLAGKSTPDAMSEFWGYSPAPQGATLEYAYYALGMGYQYSSIYYNGQQDFNTSSRILGLTTLDPVYQSISFAVYDEFGTGTYIDYYINGLYISSNIGTNYSELYLSTSPGNNYYVSMYSGGY